MVLEKTLEGHLDLKEIQLVHLKGNHSWIFIGGTDIEAETPILWQPDEKSWLIGKKRKKKTLMLEIIGGRRRRGRQRMRLLDGITDSMVWVDSGSWWWTWRPGVLQFMGSQRVGHHWAIELNWTEHGKYILKLQEGKTHTHTHTHTKNVNGATENLKPNYSSSNN